MLRKTSVCTPPWMEIKSASMSSKLLVFLHRLQVRLAAVFYTFFHHFCLWLSAFIYRLCKIWELSIVYKFIHYILCPDTEVLRKAGMQSMHTVLKLAQLRWTGHVIRMPDARLPKKVFYGELQEGKRSQGGQKKRYKDTLKASLKDFEIPMGSWEQTAQERSKWRGLINKGAALYEKKRICEAERKRRERKAKTNVPPADSMTLTCSTCNRQFRARIGLVSHQRTHQHTSALFKK